MRRLGFVTLGAARFFVPKVGDFATGDSWKTQ
jgi:hypothetical protein